MNCLFHSSVVSISCLFHSRVVSINWQTIYESISSFSVQLASVFAVCR